MRVTVTQRGGIVGDEVTLVDLDTARLGDDIKHRVEQQVSAAIASRASAAESIGTDLLNYQLVVEDRGRKQALTWIDDGGKSAAPIRDLLSRLQGLS